MKKLFLIAILGTTVVTSSNAQVKFGAKTGANFANFSGKDADGSKMKVSFNAGALVNLGITDNFSVQPEVLFSVDGAKSSSDGTDYSSNLGYVKIPIMLQFNTASGFYAEAGPQLGLLMNAKVKSGGSSVDVKDQLKSTDFGAAFGLGYKLKSGLGIGARYNLGLSSISKESSMDLKNTGFSIGIAYMFGGSK